MQQALTSQTCDICEYFVLYNKLETLSILFESNLQPIVLEKTNKQTKKAVLLYSVFNVKGGFVAPSVFFAVVQMVL